MPAELPDSYYLDNVLTLFDHVESVYADILDKQYLQFLSNFRNLSNDAQKLFIRLLNRSKDQFRLSKLTYKEIGSINQATFELENLGLIDINPDLDELILLSLFSKAELIKHSCEPVALKKLSRAELNDHLLTNTSETFFQALFDSDSFIQVLHKDTYQCLQMIFFGNLNQSMTDFVLRDLGLYQYESYRIDFDNRPYRNGEEVQHHWLLHQLDSMVELTDTDNIGSLQECFDAIPVCDDAASPLFRKSERIKYDIARQLERLGELDQAMQLYRQCHLPPGRERQARILQQQGLTQQAVDLCQTIIDTAIDESEAQFAVAFATRLVKQYKLPAMSTQPNQPHAPKTIELVLCQQPSVEQAVVEHYQSQGQAACYLENTLFNGVLGLLIWDVIFAPIAGAFYNPFQYRPSDFYAHDFLLKRMSLLDPIWSSIQNNHDIRSRVTECWQRKQGLANPLVDWQWLNLDIIELALERIPYPDWMRIFERILGDLRNNRSGFPDLIVFPADESYQLVEVKGPGDSLQKNQQRWMQYFEKHHIPHCVAKVTWLEA